MTQGDLANQFGLSAQAVSKWENDQAYPDILLLKPLSRLFGITVDALLDDGTNVVSIKDEKPEPENMLLKINVLTTDGNRVCVNLPMKLIETLVQNEGLLEIYAGKNEGAMEALRQIDFKQILQLISLGVCGRLVEVDTADGNHVEVYAE